MANSLTTNPIVLDTFTSAIDIRTSRSLAGQALMAVESIEWVRPTTTDHTCDVTALDRSGGSALDIFTHTCVTAKLNLIKYFNGQRFYNINVAESGVGSGKVIICLREERRS